MSNTTRGFTLIELVLYIALLTIVLTGVIQFSLVLSYSRIQSGVDGDVHAASRFIGKRIAFEIRNALTIQSVATSSVCLTSADSAYNPVRIYGSGTQLRIGWGGGSPTCASTTHDAPLTGPAVRVSWLQFTDVSSSSGTQSRHIHVSYTVSASQSAGRQEYLSEDSHEMSAEIRSH